MANFSIEQIAYGIRNAVYLREVREWIAQLAEFYTGLVNKLDTGIQAAAANAAAAKKSAESAASSAESAAASAKTAKENADRGQEYADTTGTNAANAAASEKEAKNQADRAAAIVSTDKTLTFDGAPADAKTVGEKLKQFLLLTGGTISGALTVTGGITGDLTGNASKWGGKTLRLEHNTTDTWIPVICDENVDYVTKTELVQELEDRLATCEQQIKAIGGTTEVLLGSVVANSFKYSNIYNTTVTMYSFGNDVSVVKFDSANLKRGSEKRAAIWEFSDEVTGNNYSAYAIFRFGTDGRLTATWDGRDSGWYDNNWEYKPTINYYKYAV